MDELLSVDETKVCTKCNDRKPISSFAIRSLKHKDIPRVSWCRDCVKVNSGAWYEKNKDKSSVSHAEWSRKNPEYQKEWNKNNPHKRKGYVLKCAYGMGIEELKRLSDLQEGKCKVCSSKMTSKGKRKMCVDHCHVSHRVRGLLCHACNAAEGLLGNPEAALSLYKYMMENELLSYGPGKN